MDWQRIFFATNRAPEGNADYPDHWFGPRRGDSLSFGSCMVSFPHDHRMGKIEQPHWWKFEFKVNPREHVVLQEATALQRGDFYSEFDKELRQRPERNALIFVHGYNVDFQAAVLRTAQLAFDLQYQGVPLLFTWPSKGKTSGYLADEATSEWSVPSFEALLDSLSQRTAATFEIVAHSMGARIVTSALAHLREQGRLPGAVHVSELVLAAPDIDADVFRRLQLRLVGAADRITLYGSDRDKAIKASQKVHEAPRAGEGGRNIIVVHGLETIDASGIATDFVDHSYVGSNRSVVTDLDGVLRGRRPPERCCLTEALKGGLAYWIFRP